MVRLQHATLGGVSGEGYAEVVDHGRGELRECKGVFHPHDRAGADVLRRMHGEETATVFSGVVYSGREEHRLTFEATITDAHIGGENDTIHFVASGNPFDPLPQAASR